MNGKGGPDFFVAGAFFARPFEVYGLEGNSGAFWRATFCLGAGTKDNQTKEKKINFKYGQPVVGSGMSMKAYKSSSQWLFDIFGQLKRAEWARLGVKEWSVLSAFVPQKKRAQRHHAFLIGCHVTKKIFFKALPTKATSSAPPEPEIFQGNS